MPEFKTFIREDDLRVLKRRIGLALPDASHAKAIELAARILGFNSYAALKAALKERGHIIADTSALTREPSVVDEELVTAAIACHGDVPERASDRPLGAAAAIASLRTALAPFDALSAPPPATETERIAALIKGRIEVPATKIAESLAELMAGRAPEGGDGDVKFNFDDKYVPVASATFRVDGHERLPDLKILEIRLLRKPISARDEDCVFEVISCAERISMARGIAVVIAYGPSEDNLAERFGPRQERMLSVALARRGYADISGFWDTQMAWIAKLESNAGITPWRLPQETAAA